MTEDELLYEHIYQRMYYYVALFDIMGEYMRERWFSMNEVAKKINGFHSTDYYINKIMEKLTR